MKTRRALLSLLLLPAFATATPVAILTPAPALAALGQEDAKPAPLEPAAKSKLTGFELPGGAFRLTDAALLGELNQQVKALAKEAGLTLRATEVLLWRSQSEAKNGELRDAVMYTFKGAGYDYQTAGEQNDKQGTATLFTARQSGGKGTVLGLWVARDGFLVLVWGSSADSAKSETVAPGRPVLPASNPPAAPSAKPSSSGQKTAVPSDLVGGTWSWTTISSVNYQNRITGQLAEPSGMSARFAFTPDGRYDYFFYARQRTYSLVTEATSTHQGKVTFNGDGTFTLRPERGHYKGSTGSRLVDRPMTEEEKKPTTFSYEWRTEDGKRQLYIGPSKSSLSRFRRAE